VIAAADAAAAALLQLGGQQKMADQLKEAMRLALAEVDMWEVVRLVEDVASSVGQVWPQSDSAHLASS
jgi:hypothetical protein